MKIWLMTAGECYNLRLLHSDAEGTTWAMQECNDGTEYHLREGWNPISRDNVLTCDCPGCTAHGPGCCDGQGCKPMRMPRALRQATDPGI